MGAAKQKKYAPFLAWLMAFLLISCAVAAHYLLDPWGYYFKVSPEEAVLRSRIVNTAEQYLGFCEAQGTHQQIIDKYNTLDPLPMGYAVQYTDSWCAVFVSTVSMECGLTEILPPECGCERQIGLFQQIDAWQELDSAIPLPGDLIYYDWNMTETGECTGWADHVGIVVGTKWPFLKVIEGNWNDSVTYRYLPLNHKSIRGFATPDYRGYLENNRP